MSSALIALIDKTIKRRELIFKVNLITNELNYKFVLRYTILLSSNYASFSGSIKSWTRFSSWFRWHSVTSGFWVSRTTSSSRSPNSKRIPRNLDVYKQHNVTSIF